MFEKDWGYNMTDTRDFSNTRCFIDFDSTLADSLPRYNVVLDDLYKDKVVEENYIEYYRDFGDAFDIIPGSPWKSILMDLVEYHAKIREVGPYSNGGSRWAPTSAVYDAGRMDVLMKVVFDADRCGNHPAVPAVYYKGASASYMVALGPLGMVDAMEAAACMPEGSFKRAVDVADTLMPDIPGIDEVLSIDEVAATLTSRFEEGCAAMFPTISYKELAIEPVIEFCRRYKDAGGHLIIHSGTNERILLSMLDTLGIRNLFEDYLCSDMLDADPNALGPWGYKTALLNKLLDRYPVNGNKDAVIGDTKGDAYGAYEVGLPFLLVWRGYPKDPSRLSGAEEDWIVPNATVDMTPDALVDPDRSFESEIEAMLDFMASVGRGEMTAPVRHTA